MNRGLLARALVNKTMNVPNEKLPLDVQSQQRETKDDIRYIGDDPHTRGTTVRIVRDAAGPTTCSLGKWESVASSSSPLKISDAQQPKGEGSMATRTATAANVTGLVEGSTRTAVLDNKEASTDDDSSCKKRKASQKPEGMPKRPLSAYNLFFRHQRQVLLGDDASGYPVTDQTRRKHRKTHGKVGFQEMARAVSDQWNKLSALEREPYERQAAELKKTYSSEKRAWRDAQPRPVAMTASTSASASAERGGTGQGQGRPVSADASSQQHVMQLEGRQAATRPPAARFSSMAAAPVAATHHRHLLDSALEAALHHSSSGLASGHEDDEDVDESDWPTTGLPPSRGAILATTQIPWPQMLVGGEAATTTTTIPHFSGDGAGLAPTPLSQFPMIARSVYFQGGRSTFSGGYNAATTMPGGGGAVGVGNMILPGCSPRGVSLPEDQFAPHQHRVFRGGPGRIDIPAHQHPYYTTASTAATMTQLIQQQQQEQDDEWLLQQMEDLYRQRLAEDRQRLAQIRALRRESSEDTSVIPAAAAVHYYPLAATTTMGPAAPSDAVVGLLDNIQPSGYYAQQAANTTTSTGAVGYVNVPVQHRWFNPNMAVRGPTMYEASHQRVVGPTTDTAATAAPIMTTTTTEMELAQLVTSQRRQLQAIAEEEEWLALRRPPQRRTNADNNNNRLDSKYRE